MIMNRILTIGSGLLLSALILPAVTVEENWATHCKKCHGDDGRGATKAGKMLKAKDLTDPQVQDELNDERIVQNLKEGLKIDGKTKMKPFAEKLSDEEISELVAFVRNFRADN